MREIKFRCWIPSKKKMFEPTSLEWYKDNCPTRPEDFAFHVAFTYDDDFIFLQFTGLHDKNGKEIYEGDIVFAHSVMSNVSGNAVWKVVWDCDEAAWYLRGKGYIRMSFASGHEVIGNIYENPELL